MNKYSKYIIFSLQLLFLSQLYLVDLTSGNKAWGDDYVNQSQKLSLVDKEVTTKPIKLKVNKESMQTTTNQTINSPSSEYLKQLPDRNFYILGPGDQVNLMVSEQAPELNSNFAIDLLTPELNGFGFP